jgi:hypothetical protein
MNNTLLTSHASLAFLVCEAAVASSTPAPPRLTPIIWRAGEDAATTRCVDPKPEASTDFPVLDDSVRRVVERLFQQHRHEFFEDGMDSVFANDLEVLVRTHRETSLLEISTLIEKHPDLVNVSAEALRVIGKINDPASRACRRWMLISSLRHPNRLVRDGAIIGLGEMDNPSSIPAVKRAIEFETSTALRTDLVQLLKQLEEPEKGYALLAESGS